MPAEKQCAAKLATQTQAATKPLHLVHLAGKLIRKMYYVQGLNSSLKNRQLDRHA